MIFLGRYLKIIKIILLCHLLLLTGCYLRYSYEDLNPKNINQTDLNKPTAPTLLEDGIWSNSTNQTPNLTFINGTDSGSGIARHEVKIIDHTNTDLDVTNFATFESNNTVTGLTLINGVNYRFAVRAVDNAGNYSTESVSDGWTVDTAAPTTPGSVTVGTVPTVYKQQTPTFTFTDSTDALSGLAFYQIEIRKTSDNSVVKSYVTATGDGSGLVYNEGSDLLTGGESYYAKIRAVDNAGNTGVAVQTGSWVALTCPTNFIAVPAKPPYSSMPFCVSKFEMKLQYNGSIVADGNFTNAHDYDGDYETPIERAKYVTVSDPSGQPWTYISRGENGITGQGAIEACQNMGIGFDLISNSQWQTIAQDAELTPSNWTSGVVGTEMMYRGHSDNSSISLSVTNINDGYDQTGNNAGQAWGSGKEQRRTLTLSNGEIIWDFAGNVWEWVKEYNTTNFGSSSYISQITDTNHAITGTVGPLTGTTKYLFGPSGTYTGLGASQYGGLGNGFVFFNAGGIFRGGGGNYDISSGVFYVNLSFGSAYLTPGSGFRCVFQPAPTQPGVITVGTLPTLFKQATPTFTFTDSVDSRGQDISYKIEIHRASDDLLIKSFTTVTGSGASGINYSEGADFLSGGESYYVNIKAINTSLEEGPIRRSPNWTALQCPTNFIAVPAKSPYTTLPFCVAKFEMKLKYNGSIVADGNNTGALNYDTDYEAPAERAKYVAVSDPSGQPWTNITRGENGAATGQGAIEACQNMGAGYDLISNAQWQTIAQDAELTPSNWTSGAVGTEMMYRGHSDNSSILLSVSNVNEGYDQTGNNAGQAWGSGKEQRRTLTMSNGEVIWDMAGNVWEWVKDNNTTNFGSSSYISQITDANHAVTGTVGSLTGTTKYLFGPSGTYTGLGATQYGGLGYGYINFNAGAVLRGGVWHYATYSGVFGVLLGGDPTSLNYAVGFRCAFQ